MKYVLGLAAAVLFFSFGVACADTTPKLYSIDQVMGNYAHAQPTAPVTRSAPAPAPVAPAATRQEPIRQVSAPPSMRVTVNGEQHRTHLDQFGRTVQVDVHVFCYIFGNQPEVCDYSQVHKQQEDIVGYHRSRW